MSEAFAPFDPRDPFGLTPDVDAYVPRAATDAAFEALCHRVLDAGGVAVLSGPSGLGKTLLLRRLAERARETLCPVYLPYASLAPDELCQWVLAALDAAPNEDPIGVLRAYAKHLKASGSALVLLVDDATVLPPPTARWLGHLAATSDGAVRAALATGDHPGAGRVIAALGEGAEVIRLTEPMSGDETRAYVRARLERARVPEASRALFDEETLSRVQRVSGGNPRRVHAAAAAVLRGEEPETIGGFLDGEVEEREGARTLEDSDTEVRPAIGADEEAEEGEVEELDLAAAPGEGGPDREQVRPYLERPPLRRVEPGPGLRWVVLTALGIAAAAVTIPLLLSQGPGGSRSAPPPRPVVVPQEEPVTETPRPAPPPRPERTAEPGLPGSALERPPDAAPGFEAEAREGAFSVPEPIEPAPEAPDLASLGVEKAAPVPGGEAAAVQPGPAGPFRVNVNATPWARIEVDGVSVGETPLAGLPLLGGEHTFRAHMPDGRVLEQVVDVSAENRFVTFE